VNVVARRSPSVLQDDIHTGGASARKAGSLPDVLLCSSQSHKDGDDDTVAQNLQNLFWCFDFALFPFVYIVRACGVLSSSSGSSLLGSTKSGWQFSSSGRHIRGLCRDETAIVTGSTGLR
jgi:hypothetical protein